MNARTYRSQLGENQAEFCRRNGLTPGTRLVGDEGYGPSVFWITALGDELLLGRSAREGKPFGHEHCLNLGCRDWSIVATAEDDNPLGKVEARP